MKANSKLLSLSLLFVAFSFSLICSAQESPTQEPLASAPVITTAVQEEQTDQASKQTALFAVIDPQNILSPDQKQRIHKEQLKIFEEHQCLVSYGFYGINNSQADINKTWQASALSQTSDEYFHILINIGSFLDKHNVEIEFRHPPLLNDINEVERILERTKKSIQTETTLEDLLERSFISINDEMAYLSTRPQLEKSLSEQLTISENAAFKRYIIKLVKIGLCAIGFLVALFLCWNLFNTSRNKKPYHFPETTSARRLSAPHAATSVYQINP